MKRGAVCGVPCKALAIGAEHRLVVGDEDGVISDIRLVPGPGLQSPGSVGGAGTPA
jgi:hypothetical protein